MPSRAPRSSRTLPSSNSVQLLASRSLFLGFFLSNSPQNFVLVNDKCTNKMFFKRIWNITIDWLHFVFVTLLDLDKLSKSYTVNDWSTTRLHETNNCDWESGIKSQWAWIKEQWSGVENQSPGYISDGTFNLFTWNFDLLYRSAIEYWEFIWHRDSACWSGGIYCTHHHLYQLFIKSIKRLIWKYLNFKKWLRMVFGVPTKIVGTQTIKLSPMMDFFTHQQIWMIQELESIFSQVSREP